MDLRRTPEDDYEPPPHVLARLSGLASRLGRVVLRGRAVWRWSWVGLVLFEALLYLNLVPILTRHLPYRFLAEARGALWWNFQLFESMRRDPAEFIRLALRLGAYTTIVAPFAEESLFRGGPILLARALGRRLGSVAGRTVTIAVAAFATLLFAWMHHPVLGAMPIPQLLFGTLAWLTAWRWGLRYSILLHVLVNLLLFASLIVRICEITG